MTIYSAKSNDKKKEEALGESVECGTSENQVNEEKDGTAVGKTTQPRSRILNLVTHRGKRLVMICIVTAVVVILICGIILGVVVYNTGLDKLFHGWCDVRYYDYNKESHEPRADGSHSSGHRFHHRQYDGSFRQEIVIDLDRGLFERIEVPRIKEARKAIIIHDFAKNLTAIADHEYTRCFILPLSRNLVMPPRDLFNMLNQMKMSSFFFYMPDVEIIREAYQAVTPPVQRMTPFGYNIWKECHACDTYLLTKSSTFILSKRNACELSGAQYCLGDAGTDRVLCIKIKDCV